MQHWTSPASLGPRPVYGLRRTKIVDSWKADLPYRVLVLQTSPYGDILMRDAGSYASAEIAQAVAAATTLQAEFNEI